jgi:hypothetical protein
MILSTEKQGKDNSYFSQRAQREAQAQGLATGPRKQALPSPAPAPAEMGCGASKPEPDPQGLFPLLILYFNLFTFLYTKTHLVLLEYFLFRY